MFIAYYFTPIPHIAALSACKSDGTEGAENLHRVSYLAQKLPLNVLSVNMGNDCRATLKITFN